MLNWKNFDWTHNALSLAVLTCRRRARKTNENSLQLHVWSTFFGTPKCRQIGIGLKGNSMFSARPFSGAVAKLTESKNSIEVSSFTRLVGPGLKNTKSPEACNVSNFLSLAIFTCRRQTCEIPKPFEQIVWNALFRAGSTHAKSPEAGNETHYAQPGNFYVWSRCSQNPTTIMSRQFGMLLLRPACKR